MTLVNHGSRPREVELTSFAEVCLNHRRADQAHPAFAKLFLETEFDPGSGSLLVRRRPRGANENPVWAIHRLGDRRRGERTHRVRDGPGAIPRARPYPGQSRRPGPRGEPVAGRPARCWIRSSACGAASASSRERRRAIAFVTGAADTREAALGIAGQFRDLEAIDRAFAAARTRCHDELREMSLTPGDVALFDRLAAAVVFTSPDSGSPTPWPRTAWDNRGCGRMPSRATCPSCWSGSRRPEMSPSFASSFSGMPMPAVGAWSWTW